MTGSARTVELVCHPDTPSAALDRIEVAVEHGPLLRLDYRMIGRVGEVLIPPPAAPERADGLWRTTCFEAFLADRQGYIEFNLAPSGQWASYRFDAYREGMREANVAPRVETHRDGLTAIINPGEGARLGLSAVIEERGGAKSYWALAHPPGTPDFHHPDCFTIDLAAARQA